MAVVQWIIFNDLKKSQSKTVVTTQPVLMNLSYYKPFIIRWIRLASKIKKDVGHEIKRAAEYIGHEIKENTELAEHETGVQNVKKSAKSAFNKVKEAI